MATTTFVDFDPFGRIDNQGQITTLYGHEAIEASMRLFLASFKGEFVRNPDKGGYLVRLLTKPMNEEIAKEIKATLEEAIALDFTPLVVVKEIEVVPDYIKDAWQISVKGYCPLVKEEINFSEQFKHF